MKPFKLTLNFFSVIDEDSRRLRFIESFFKLKSQFKKIRKIVERIFLLNFFCSTDNFH